MNNELKPIAEQPRPDRVDEDALPAGRSITISGFPSRAMHKAYYAYLSGPGLADLHEVFGTWCDVNGVE